MTSIWDITVTDNKVITILYDKDFIYRTVKP